MTKKAFWVATVVLSLWNLLYIVVLSDSLITEYFLDRFFYWGYPQWGVLYSSPRLFLWFNLLYLLFLLAGMATVCLLRRRPARAFAAAAFIAVLALSNLYAPYCNWNRQFKLYTDDEGRDISRIPEGKWLMDLREMQHYDDQSVMMKLKGWWGRGDWPGGYAFWGGSRVWMQPDTDTDDQGRRGFVLHGGTRKGSPWGINLGSEMADFVASVHGFSVPLELNVNYKKNAAAQNSESENDASLDFVAD